MIHFGTDFFVTMVWVESRGALMAVAWSNNFYITTADLYVHQFNEKKGKVLERDNMTKKIVQQCRKSLERNKKR